MRNEINRRPGFSIIELLVVISLIITIMALTAGAFFRVRGAQNRAATESTMIKLNTALDARLKAINEQVNADAASGHKGFTAALTLVGNNNVDAAKAVWTYALLKNELPMTFAEATSGISVGTYYIPAKQMFLTELSGATSTGSQEESAVCFFMAITQSSTGGTVFALDGLSQQTGDVIVGGRSFLCVKDAWGTPIAFTRHCYDPSSEVNAPPYVRQGQARDPLFPVPNKNLATVFPGMTSYWSIVRASTPGFANMPGSYPGPQNHLPTLISAGPNRVFDGNPHGLDDIVGYRLRRDGARGD